MNYIAKFLTLCTIILTLNAKDRLEHVSLQLKWFHSFQFAGYYMAKEKGYYKDVGLDVEIIQRDPKKTILSRLFINNLNTVWQTVPYFFIEQKVQKLRF